MTLARIAWLPIVLLFVAAATGPASAQAPAPVKGTVAAGATPPWNKGIQPIGQENYWNAMECGKQGGANPPCVFYDSGLCKNEEYTLALYSPYKFVAYSVWQAVSQKKPAPTPSYQMAQQTRVVFGVRPLKRDNPITAVNIKRGTRVVKPATQTLDGGGGTFIFDFAAVAPTSGITIEFVGKARTQACVIDKASLARMR